MEIFLGRDKYCKALSMRKKNTINIRKITANNRKKTTKILFK